MHFLPPRLRDVWEEWAALFTTGSIEKGAAEHYALRVDDVPSALVWHSLEDDVDAWIAEREREEQVA